MDSDEIDLSLSTLHNSCSIKHKSQRIGKSWEMLSSEDYITVVHMNVQQLKLPAENLQGSSHQNYSKAWLVTEKWLLTVDG